MFFLKVTINTFHGRLTVERPIPHDTHIDRASGRFDSVLIVYNQCSCRFLWHANLALVGTNSRKLLLNAQIKVSG